MNGDRFDDLARALARLSDGLQSRRSLIASAITGAAIGLRTAPSTAAPSGRRELEFRNQEDQADPLIYETAFNLQFDVDKIFQFVRDEVAYDPYAGVLRGARGTLWGLAGNAADQAVLLAALLNAALIPTRYVIGELPPDSAERLLGTAFPDEETTLRRTAQVILPPIPAEAALPLTSEERAFVEGLPGFAGRFRDSVDQHATAGLGIVADALTRAGITIPTPALALPELEENQHVWIQYSVGTQWIDLDPSMPGSEAGEVHATDHSVHDQLPPDIFHRVTLRLVAEQVVGGTLERRELISHSAPSADLVGVPLTIFHPQAEALKAMGQQITGEIGGFRNYMTTLLVGEEVVSGLPVTFATGEGVFDVVGSSSVVDGDTIGEWLEIEIGTPDGVRRVTRELFDRVGLANRETSSIDLAAIPALDLVDAGDPESSFLPLAGFWSISVLSGPTPASFLSGAQGQDSPVTDFAEIAHTYHYVRDVFSLRSGQDGARTYFDEPNLTAIVVRPTVISADSQTAATGIDLLYRSLAVVGAPESDSPVHPLISAGVLGHAVEQAMAEAGADPLFDLPLESTSGVGRVFAAAKAEGIATIVLDPGIGEPTLPMVSEEALIRIREALSLGLVVIVPERSVSLGGIQRSGWWLVDPVTGSTFDQMDDGGGAQLVEYIFAVAKLISCGVILFAIAAGIYFVAVGTSLTLVPSRDEGSSDADVASAAAAARAAGAYGAGRRAAGSGAVAGGATALCAM